MSYHKNASSYIFVLTTTKNLRSCFGVTLLCFSKVNRRKETMKLKHEHIHEVLQLFKKLKYTSTSTKGVIIIYVTPGPGEV